jgi:hypothetical protein
MFARARYRGRHRGAPDNTRDRTPDPRRVMKRVRSLAAAGAAAAVLIVLPAAAAYASGPLFRQAVQVKPPLDATTSPFDATIDATACTGTGNCVAGGSYNDAHGAGQAFVASESHGAWRRGTKLLLPSSATKQPNARVTGLACISAGNCVAVGQFYHNAAQDNWALISTETNGKWARAFVPSPPANANRVATYLNAVSCTTKGFCAAVGGYTDKAGRFQAMALVKPVGKRWQRAVEIVLPKGALNGSVVTNIGGIACTAVGKCVAVGNYGLPGPGFHSQAMGVVRTGTGWHRAVPVGSPSNALHPGFAYLDGVSCQAGKCTAVGSYYFATNAYRAMSATESNGRFRAAKEIINAPANAAPVAATSLFGISCPPAGSCVAVGHYTNVLGRQASMYMTLAAGKWKAFTLVPPSNASSSSGRSIAYSVACTGNAHCTGVGWYVDTAGQYRADAASTG